MKSTEYLEILAQAAGLDEEIKRRQIVSRMAGVQSVNKSNIDLYTSLEGLNLTSHDTNVLTPEQKKYVGAFWLVTCPIPAVRQMVRGEKLIDIFKEHIRKPLQRCFPRADSNLLSKVNALEEIIGGKFHETISQMPIASPNNNSAIVQISLSAGGLFYAFGYGYKTLNGEDFLPAGIQAVGLSIIGLTCLSIGFVNLQRNMRGKFRDFEKKIEADILGFQDTFDEYIDRPLDIYVSKNNYFLKL